MGGIGIDGPYGDQYAACRSSSRAASPIGYQMQLVLRAHVQQELLASLLATIRLSHIVLNLFLAV